MKELSYIRQSLLRWGWTTIFSILCVVWVGVVSPPVYAADVSDTQYTVQPGDTLWGTAERYYNNGFAWPDIAQPNNIQDPHQLEIGRLLTIPHPSPGVSSILPPIALPTPAVRQSEPDKLEKYLTVETALLGVSDNISLYFREPGTGREVTIEPTRSWIPASMIKSYVALEAFRQRQLGILDFDETVTIVPQNVVSTELETDEFPRLREGTQATVRQLVEAMVTQSDNTAYNTLLDILDRRNINLTLKNLGLTQTVVGEKLNLDDAQFQVDLQVPGRQPNTTTVKDITSFFDLLYANKVTDAEEILAIFKRQKINSMIPALLPDGTVVAHKTGDWAPIYHDAGVVYKPATPFILSIFTNSNSPSVLAQLSRVAYYQTADVVGQDVESVLPKKKVSGRYMQKISLVPGALDSAVLGVTTNPADEKFPKVTAADLGITVDDLTVNKRDAQKIRGALVNPGSIFYPLKQFLEARRLAAAKTSNDRISAYLDQALSRVAEVKTLLRQNELTAARLVLEQSEGDLKQAVTLGQTTHISDTDLLRIRQVRDVHFAVLAQSARLVKQQDKEKFIDAVYSFYKKNQADVEPIIKSVVIANPFEQQPVIATVGEVNGDNVSLHFEDGTTKEVTVPPSTLSRDFHQEGVERNPILNKGTRIALVGQNTKEGKIVPLFILRNIPKELPDKHEGTVLEIDPEKNILKIQDQKGHTEDIKIEDTTIMKGKDTGVSIEGIKAGSRITVFGENTARTRTPQTNQGQSQSGGSSSPSNEVKATTVTVTTSSSGAHEESKKEDKKEDKKEESKKQDSNANPPAKEEKAKKEDKKDKK